jgi:hypothetical protein
MTMADNKEFGDEGFEVTEEELIEHMESERKRGNTIQRKDVPGPNGIRHLCRISMNGMVVVTEGRPDKNGVVHVHQVPETDWTGENN